MLTALLRRARGSPYARSKPWAASRPTLASYPRRKIRDDPKCIAKGTFLGKHHKSKQVASLLTTETVPDFFLWLDIARCMAFRVEGAATKILPTGAAQPHVARCDGRKIRSLFYLACIKQRVRRRSRAHRVHTSLLRNRPQSAAFAARATLTLSRDQSARHRRIAVGVWNVLDRFRRNDSLARRDVTSKPDHLSPRFFFRFAFPPPARSMWLRRCSGKGTVFIWHCRYHPVFFFGPVRASGSGQNFLGSLTAHPLRSLTDEAPKPRF